MRKFAALVLGVVLLAQSLGYSAQRKVLDWSKPETKKINWKMDGNIYIFDCKLENRRFSNPAKVDFLKVDCPHEGMWVKVVGPDLPEHIKARYFHISSDGSRMNGKARPTVRGEPKEGTADKLIQDANAVYDVGNFDEALAMYVAFFNQFGKHPYAPFAMFMAGQSLCAKHKFKESIAIHKALVAKYPTSKTAPQALYRIACVTAGHLDKREEGILLFSSILKKFPEHKIAQDCLFNIAALHLIFGEVKQAAAEFALLLKKYPKGYRAKSAKLCLQDLSKAAGK